MGLGPPTALASAPAAAAAEPGQLLAGRQVVNHHLHISRNHDFV